MVKAARFAFHKDCFAGASRGNASEKDGEDFHLERSRAARARAQLRLVEHAIQQRNFALGTCQLRTHARWLFENYSSIANAVVQGSFLVVESRHDISDQAG